MSLFLRTDLIETFMRVTTHKADFLDKHSQPFLTIKSKTAQPQDGPLKNAQLMYRSNSLRGSSPGLLQWHMRVKAPRAGGGIMYLPARAQHRAATCEAYRCVQKQVRLWSRVAGRSPL